MCSPQHMSVDRLAAEFGSVVWRRRLDSSPRSEVWHADVAGAPAVIKKIVGGPDADARFQRELAALQLAARADPPVVPAILGTVPEQRVMLLEYLPDHQPGHDWAVGYARALARLHAVTTDLEARSMPSLPPWSPPSAGDVEAFLRLAREVGVAAPPGVRQELDDVLRRQAEAGGGKALLHGDPCPDNYFNTNDGIRFIDLEQAALGNPLTELAYLRIGFPTCWCVTAVPTPLLLRAEAAYYTEWRVITGTTPSGDLTDACIGWLLRGDALIEKARRDGTDHLAQLTDRDWRWGTATARQRLLHRLTVTQQATSERTDHTAIHRLLVGAMRGELLMRWPGRGWRSGL